MSGRSKRAPYIHGEQPHARHQRRKRIARDDVERLKGHLAALGAFVSIHNDGGHWQISVRGREFDWWPETARLVVDHKWGSPRKCHDVDQVVKVVRRLTGRP